jgi:hypothetical protein
MFGQSLEECIHLIAFQIDGPGGLDTLGWNGLHALSFRQHFWVVNGEIPVKRAQGSKPLIPSPRLVPARFLNRAQKIQHAVKREISEREPRNGPTAQAAHVD